MKKFLAAALLLMVFATPAFAAKHYHYRHHATHPTHKHHKTHRSA